MTVVSLCCLIFLSACKKTSNPVISADKVDKAVIFVKDDKGKEHSWEGQDSNFLKTLLGNINLLFDKSDTNAQRFDMDLTSEQKIFKYQIKFYKENKVVQDIQVSKNNKVTIDRDKFTIGEDKEKELNSLKNHLLLVTGLSHQLNDNSQ
ncbi:MAG TPA: hypothetical protein DIS85_12030 [Vagococcus sp.]|nr:hypothetical protein [Vagococcus sp.]